MSRLLLRFLLPFSFLAIPHLALPETPPHRQQPAAQGVQQCSQVSLSAAYLAQITPAEGPGFLLIVSNGTDHPIKLAKPFPTSAHWYAQTHEGRWFWRASSGSGGELVDALRERGPVFAHRARVSGETHEYVTVGAHGRLEWTESMSRNPTLRFRPGCQRCSNPGDEQFRAVLAYAYLAAPREQIDGLLTCGLRSGPIVMPPLP